MNWYTDHVALVSTLRSENVPGKISEWQLALSEFDLHVRKDPRKGAACGRGNVWDHMPTLLFICRLTTVVLISRN